VCFQLFSIYPDFSSIYQIAERERSKTGVGQPLYTLLTTYWKEVRPYEFAGLTDDERRKMWRQARQSLYSLGIPDSDPAWDHVRTQPGLAGTGPPKAGAGPKRAAGSVNAERKKNTGSTSKTPVEAKDEGIRPSQTAKVREEVMQAPRSTKAVPRRDNNPPPRRPPGVSGPKNARETPPSQSQLQSQAQGPSKKAGLADARAKHGDSLRPNGRPGPATLIHPSSSHERELERERPTRPTKKEREDGSDLDREKGKVAAAHKAKRRKDDVSDLESLRDWDGTDGKANAKRKKLREDYDDKDRVNGTGNTVKRRKVTEDDKPYKPGGGGGNLKARERDRDKEPDRREDKTRDRDPPHVAKRPRDSDWDSPDPSPLPRKPIVRERDRQRERGRDRSVSPPRRVKREFSLSPALHNSHQRESSPRVTIKRISPPREPVKREGSPRLRGQSRRGDSPPAPQNSKRAPSPSRSQTRARDRDRESSTNGGSTMRRRRSPIYTSSEEEQHNAPVRRNAPSSVTSSSSSREPVRAQGYARTLPPTTPYPKDREALQARYRSGYRSYIAVYYKLLEERAKIQDALDDLGREGSVCSDRDVEMMDEEGLRELKGQYAAWTRELEGIRNAHSAEADRMDITT
jgi:RNA polymerase II elongation factor ELL